MVKFFRLKNNAVLTGEALRGHAGWVGLLLLNLIIVLSLRNHIISPRISSWIPQLMLNLYLLVVYIYGQFKIRAVERYDFLQLILKMLVFGIFASFFSFFIEAVFYLFSDQAFSQHLLVINTVYLLSLVLISTYLIILLIAYKRLILYEKSRILLIAWRIFEYALIASMVLGVFNIRVHNTLSDVFLIALVGMGLILSVNLKWVGYLDFKQKWRGLLMLLGVAGCLAYFCFFVSLYAPDSSIFLNLVDNVFILALLAFCLFYTLLSCLVIFFNLPTSSVYERKLQEIKGFQKLNRTVQNEESKEKLLITLLENSLSAIDADFGWVELNLGGEEGEVQIIGNNPGEEELNEIIGSIKRPALRKVFIPGFNNPSGKEYFLGSLLHSTYRSMLVVPLVVQEKHAGLLVLVKDVEGAFNMDAVELVKTYADHTCISIENIRLLKEALRNERYQEEIAIARRVQRSLLPEKLEHNEGFDLAVYSESADEVGGDYYDTYQLNEQQYVLVIADVAGHGTSAAFAMSQLKGIFHSLVPLGLSSKEFVVRANEALSKGLDKSTFVTLTYILIDTGKKMLELVRAGHCPALYFSRSRQEFMDFQNKGMGLGILRNNEFASHLQENFVNYGAEDLMVLYTDGITESKNSAQEEFGVERLQQVVRQNARKNVVEVQKAIVEELKSFVGSAEIKDDFTTMIVKFS